MISHGNTWPSTLTPAIRKIQLIDKLLEKQGSRKWIVIVFHIFNFLMNINQNFVLPNPLTQNILLHSMKWNKTTSYCHEVREDKNDLCKVNWYCACNNVIYIIRCYFLIQITTLETTTKFQYNPNVSSIENNHDDLDENFNYLVCCYCSVWKWGKRNFG